MITALGLIAWGGLALLLGLAIGRTIREADRRAEVERSHAAAARQDWLADQPTEVLAPTEIDRRFRAVVGGKSTRTWSA